MRYFFCLIELRIRENYHVPTSTSSQKIKFKEDKEEELESTEWETLAKKKTIRNDDQKRKHEDSTYDSYRHSDLKDEEGEDSNKNEEVETKWSIKEYEWKMIKNNPKRKK